MKILKLFEKMFFLMGDKKKKKWKNVISTFFSIHALGCLRGRVVHHLSSLFVLLDALMVDKT